MASAAAQVLFRTLGLIPGSASQDGEWKALDGRRYQVRAHLPARAACNSSSHICKRKAD